jgi:hypothetical protein
MQPSARDKAAANTRTGIFTRTRSPQRCSSPFRKCAMRCLLRILWAAVCTPAASWYGSMRRGKTANCSVTHTGMASTSALRLSLEDMALRTQQLPAPRPGRSLLGAHLPIGSRKAGYADARARPSCCRSSRYAEGAIFGVYRRRSDCCSKVTKLAKL